MLTEIGVWLAVIIAVLVFWDCVQTPDQKTRAKDWLRNASQNADRAGPMVVVARPARAVGRLFDLILGKKLCGWRAYLCVAAIGTALLICALGIYGLLTKNMLAGAAPWNLYDQNMDGARRVLAKPPTGTGASVVLAIPRFFVRYDSVFLRVLYSCAVTVGVIAINSTINFACVVLIRNLLRDLQRVRGITLYLAALVFDVILAWLALACGLLLSLIIAQPLLGLSLVVLAAMSAIVSITGPFIAIQILTVALWKLGGPAIRIEALIAVLPTLLVSLSLAWAVASFPLKVRIHRVVILALERAARSDAGVLALVAALIGILGAVLALAVYYLPSSA